MPSVLKKWVLLALILGATFVALSPTLDNGLTNWDDDRYVLNNPHIKDLSINNVGKLFKIYFQGNYHPLTLLSLGLEYRAVGPDPSLYHFDNLMLHLLNTALVFWLIWMLTGRLGIAGITAVLFGLHPLHVESVAWISERKDLLYGAFYLAALISYVYHLKSEKGGKYLLIAGLFFVGSLLSKGMAVTLPLAFFLIDYLLRKPFKIKPKLPFLLLALVFGIVAIQAQASAEALVTTDQFSFGERLFIASYGFSNYIYKFIVPVPLSTFYPYPQGGLSALFYLSFLVPLSLAWLMFKFRQQRELIFGLGFFVLHLALVIQLVPFGEALMADRYSYLPYIGLGYLGAWAMDEKVPDRFKRFGNLMLLAFIGLLFFGTFNRTKVWKDSQSLWTDVIKKYPGVQRAYVNRSEGYIQKGQWDLAIMDYNQALKLQPNDPKALNNRANAYKAKGQYRLAITDYSRALELNPNFPEGYNNRGLLYLATQEYQKALKDFNRALNLNKRLPALYLNRSLVWVQLKDTAAALKDLGQALSLERRFIEAFDKRTDIYEARGELELAIQDLGAALKLEGSPQRYVRRANLYNYLGKVKLAIDDYNRCLQMAPNHNEALFNRALSLQKNSDIDGAIKDYTRLMRLNTKFRDVYFSRAIAYLGKMDYRNALADMQHADSLGYPVPPALYEMLHHRVDSLDQLD